MHISQLKIESFQLLEKLFGRQRVLEYYKRYCINIQLNRGIIFIHIPKNGGTSITHHLYGKRAGHYTALEIKNYLGDERFLRLPSFCLTRNPIDRLISAYQYAVNGGGSQGGIRKKKEYKSAEFKSFSTFVKEWLIFQKPESLEIIFKPQHLFVSDEYGNSIVKWIGKIEEPLLLEREFEIMTGQRITLERLNITRGRKNLDDINDNILDLILNFYKRDFTMFNYNMKF